MKENTTKIFEKRKRKVAKRLERKQWKSQAKPMFATSNIHYEIDGRHEGIACGDIGEASMYMANMVAASFSKVTVIKTITPFLWKIVERSRIKEKCVSTAAQI